MNQNRTEWVIHVWGKTRDSLELNSVERFHIDMLRMFQDQQKKFDKILVNIAMDDIKDTGLYEFLKKEIESALVCKDVEFKSCQNDIRLGEYVTFRPYVFDRIGEDVDVFYSHFKGYSTYFKVNRESFPKRVSDFNEMFWSYIMYRYSLNLGDVKKHLKDKSVYFWSILKGNGDERNMGYYKIYMNGLLNIEPKLTECIEGEKYKHSPGSFGWYNLKNIGKSLKDKSVVKSISTESLMNAENGKISLCTHFSELYIWKFLKDEECYTIKDYSDILNNIEIPLYVNIYSSKLFGKEYVKDFEKYLIDNKLM